MNKDIDKSMKEQWSKQGEYKRKQTRQNLVSSNSNNNARK